MGPQQSAHFINLLFFTTVLSSAGPSISALLEELIRSTVRLSDLSRCLLPPRLAETESGKTNTKRSGYTDSCSAWPRSVSLFQKSISTVNSMNGGERTNRNLWRMCTSPSMQVYDPHHDALAL
jgi:hypothetical protein